MEQGDGNNQESLTEAHLDKTVSCEIIQNEKTPEEFEKIEEDFKALVKDFPELENYEDWCGISEEFKKLINEIPEEEQKFLFKNEVNESEDDDEEEHQADLCKKYRKFIRELFSTP